MFGLSMGELLVILAIVLLMFGAKRLPDLAKGLGGAVHAFKKGIRGDEESVKTIESGNGTQVPNQQSSSSKVS